MAGGEASGSGMEFCSNQVLESFVAVSDLEAGTIVSDVPPTPGFPSTSGSSAKPGSGTPALQNLPWRQRTGFSLGVLFRLLLQS